MKRSVDVLVFFSRSGTMIPMAIHWDDEHIFEIDAVKKITKTSVWSDGRESFGRIAHLYDGPDKWYVEEV